MVCSVALFAALRMPVSWRSLAVPNGTSVPAAPR